MTSLDDLKESVRKLQALLDDPHPGLATWNVMLMDRCREIGAEAVEHEMVPVKKALTSARDALAEFELRSFGAENLQEAHDLCEDALKRLRRLTKASKTEG